MASTATKKPLISPALQAKFLLLRVAMTGLVRDFWKDAPMPWPRWLKEKLAKYNIQLGQAAKKAGAGAAAKWKQPAQAHPQAAQKGEAVHADVKPVQEPKPWTADRVQVMEAMWGEGNNFPGGEDYITALSSPLGINHEMSILDLSAGLGGLARQLAETYKVYVTGMEPDSTIAARGMIISIAMGKSKTASIVGYDPVQYTASRKYDCIFARELFYKIIGKEKFFKAVDSSLKTGGGQIVFTDYILDPEARNKPAVAAWLAREKNAAPISMIEMIKMWKGMGYDLRIAEDQTHMYKNAILMGLKNIATHMTMNIPDHSTKGFVVSEVDLWAKRMAAFHEGLRYCRFFGIKY